MCDHSNTHTSDVEWFRDHALTYLHIHGARARTRLRATSALKTPVMCIFVLGPRRCDGIAFRMVEASVLKGGRLEMSVPDVRLPRYEWLANDSAAEPLPDYDPSRMTMVAYFEPTNAHNALRETLRAIRGDRWAPVKFQLVSIETLNVPFFVGDAS